jgi:polyisoprenoid-binding protein YceI
MRHAAMIIALGLAACASVEGATNQPPPFTVAPTASAASAAPVFNTAIDLPAGVYRLDPNHASVVFRIRHMELAWFTARFDAIEAELDLDPADPSRSRLTASVEASSVNTGVVNRAGERAFDTDIARALGGGEIEFVSTAIERTGEFTARVSGDLSMNGQTHPATLEATFDGGAVDPLRGGRQVLGFSAHGRINRSDWGVSQWRAFTGDEVQIVIEAELVKTS